MDLQRLKHLEEILKDRDHFSVETAAMQGDAMLFDLQERLRRNSEMPWQFGLLAGKFSTEPSRATGLILIELRSENRFAGLYYENANCGGADDASKLTARMLLQLDAWPSAEGIIQMVATFSRLRITSLGGSNRKETLPIRHQVFLMAEPGGPSIEPID
jgi:hypothetical protein